MCKIALAGRTLEIALHLHLDLQLNNDQIQLITPWHDEQHHRVRFGQAQTHSFLAPICSIHQFIFERMAPSIDGVCWKSTPKYFLQYFRTIRTKRGQQNRQHHIQRSWLCDHWCWIRLILIATGRRGRQLESTILKETLKICPPVHGGSDSPAKLRIWLYENILRTFWSGQKSVQVSFYWTWPTRDYFFVRIRVWYVM